MAAMGYLGRGLAIVRAFTKVREVGAGKGVRARLFDNALHLQTLSDMTVEYHGMMLLTFYSSYVMGMEEHAGQDQYPPPTAVARITPQGDYVVPLLRVLTPVLKAYCTKQCIPLLYACMESLGGVGYLENSENGVSQHRSAISRRLRPQHLGGHNRCPEYRLCSCFEAPEVRER
ncbi:hypothetical protein PG987_003354 [Apiospora arundinis]